MEIDKSIDLQPVGVGCFGNVYDQFRGRVKEAFDFLIAHKSGDLIGVFYDEEIGDIDLVWGSEEERKGLEHIIAKHVGEGKDFSSLEEVRSVIEIVICQGKKIKKRWDKVTFDHGGYRVIVSKNLRDAQGNIILENKNWVVTSFDNNNPKSKKKASDITLVTPDNTHGGRAVASDAISKLQR